MHALSQSDLEKEFRENLKYARDFWAPYVQDTKRYTEASAGKTWTEQEIKALVDEGREPIEYNIMRRPLQFFSGYLRDNLNSVVYGPAEGSDQETSDQLSEMSYQIWDKGRGTEVFLDAEDEAFKSGISLCGIQMDYSKDFVNGDISFYKRTYNSFYLDPTFTRMDLADCGFAITRDLIGKDYAKQLLSKQVSAKEVDEISVGYRDDKFMNYHPQFKTFSRNRNLVAYDQYYTRTTRVRKFLTDLDSGFYRDITDMDKEELDTLKAGIKRMNDMRADFELTGQDTSEIPNVEIRDEHRPYIKLNVMLNGQEVFTGEDDTGIVDTYSFVPCICYMEPSIWHPSYRIQGMASTTWSLQRQFNKRHMKITDMMDSDISTGYAYLIGAVRDPTEMQQSGQNKMIGVESDPDINPRGLDAIKELSGGGANPALIQYQEILDKLSLTLGNVTEATLGTDEKRNTLVSGRLAQVQIAQNLVTNRKVFDNVDQSQMLLGGLVLKAIQANYPPGKVKRMINKEPTQQFYDKQFEQFDVVIKEGVRSKSQKDAYYYELINLTKDGVVDVPQSEIVRALEMTGADDLKKSIEEQDQQKAEQQQKVDEQERLALELGNAEKEQKLALAQERRARVISDISLAEERASEAEENRAQAALAKAKTLTEIASMEDDRLLKVLDFVNTLEQQEIQDRELINQDIKATANSLNTDTEGTAESQRVEVATQQLNQEAENANV